MRTKLKYQVSCLGDIKLMRYFNQLISINPGIHFSFIQPRNTFLRLYIRGSTQKDAFMLSTQSSPAPDEVRFELETGSSVFIIGAPAVPFLWKVSLITKCFLEGAIDNGLWVPPTVELFVAVCHAASEIFSFDKYCHISSELKIVSGGVLQRRMLDSTFQLSASIRIIGGSPEIWPSNWRLIAKTFESDQIVWISDAIQISFGTVALKVLSSSNEVCFIGTRCVFELKASNPFGISASGASVTIVNQDESIGNFSFVPRFHSAVSNRHGLITLSVELKEEALGGVVILGFIIHDSGGSRFFTTKNVTVVNIVDSIIAIQRLEFSKDLASTAFAPSFHFRSNITGETIFLCALLFSSSPKTACRTYAPWDGHKDFYDHI